MAHLWIRQSDRWAVLPLPGGTITIDEVCRAAGTAPADPARATLHRTTHGREEWHLVTEPGAPVAVNGLRVPAGLRTLRDRDELLVAGLGRAWFSTERLAEVEPLPPSGHQVSCPRCRQRIHPGTPAIRCPGCDLWHHASEDLPCWGYAPTCAMCPQSTEPDAGFRWMPEEH